MLKISVNGKFIELTSQEVEILRLISAGFTMGRIAQDLFISREEVRSTCQQLQIKCGMSSMDKLILIGLESGIL